MLGTIIGVIIGLLTILPLICIQTFFYSKMIGLNQKCKGLRLVLTIFIFSIIMFILNVNASFRGMLLTLILIILYPALFLGCKLKDGILFGILNCAIYLFSGLISLIIVSPVSWVDLHKIPIPELLMILAVSYVVYVILLLIIIHLNTDGKHYMPSKYWTGVIISFTVIVIALFIVSNFNTWFRDIEKLQIYTTIFTIGVLSIWLLMYFLLYFVCQYFSKATEASILSVQNNMIERYILRKQETDERIRMLSHDLKHSLVQWRIMAEEKGEINVLQNITEYERQLLSSLLINVENESASAIINQKYLEAKQAKVTFQVDGIFHKDLIMCNLDLCSLLGNMLDNAIEAAAKVETEALRCVRLSIKRKGNLLIMVVENGYAIEPIVKDGVFITLKKDKFHHAIGMMSIRYVTEKYNGVVKNSYENNWFKSSVMLSGYHAILSNKK